MFWKLFGFLLPIAPILLGSVICLSFYNVFIPPLNTKPKNIKSSSAPHHILAVQLKVRLTRFSFCVVFCSSFC
jgi:hypothetical protein